MFQNHVINAQWDFCPRLEGWGHSAEGFQGGSVVKNPPPMQRMQVRSLGQEGLLEEEMATHSSILAGESHG